MLSLYNPTTKAVVATDGIDNVSPQMLLLNILIDIRAGNAAMMDAQRGLVTQTLAQYRNDVVNGTVNPFF